MTFNTVEQLAYLAGILDGEGAIGIARRIEGRKDHCH